MAAPAALLPALLIGGAAATVAVVAVVRSNQGGDGSSASGGGPASSGAGEGGVLDSFGGLTDAVGGLPQPSGLAGTGLDAYGEATGAASGLVPGGVPNVSLGLSAGAERKLLRDSRQRVRNSNLDTAANVAILGTLVVPAVRRAAGSMAVQRAIRLSPVASRVAAGARLATPVAAGAGLGVLGVKVLDKTGALDAMSRASSKAGAKLQKTAAGRTVATVVKSSALPVSTVGAVAHGIATKATVKGNVKQAYSGTVVQRGAQGVGRLVRKVF